MHGNGQRLLGEFEWRSGDFVPKRTRPKRNSSSVDHAPLRFIQKFSEFLKVFAGGLTFAHESAGTPCCGVSGVPAVLSSSNGSGPRAQEPCPISPTQSSCARGRAHSAKGCFEAGLRAFVLSGA